MKRGNLKLRNKVILMVAGGIVALIGAAWLFGFLDNSSIKNINNREVIEPHYQLVHGIYPDRISLNASRDTVLFYESGNNEIKASIYIYSLSDAKLIKTQLADTYIQGPYWEDDYRVYLEAMDMDRYDITSLVQPCMVAYVGEAPAWDFKQIPCGQTRPSRHQPSQKSPIPANSDTRGIGSVWATSSTGIVAAETYDRTYVTQTIEGSRQTQANDIRLIDSNGCTIGQLGGNIPNPYDINLVGWTKDEDLLVLIKHGSYSRSPGLYKVTKQEIETLTKRSCQR